MESVTDPLVGLTSLVDDEGGVVGELVYVQKCCELVMEESFGPSDRHRYPEVAWTALTLCQLESCTPVFTDNSMPRVH